MTTLSDIQYMPLSGDLTVDALLDDGPMWNYLTTTGGNWLYYSYVGDGAYNTAVSQVNVFNANQIAATNTAMAYIESVTGIDFIYTSNPLEAQFTFLSADILWSNTIGLTAWESSYSYSGNTVTRYDASAEIFLDYIDFPVNLDPDPGTSGYQVLLHEIAHALGLKHPFEGTYQLPYSLDNTDHTLMSYTWVGDPKSEFQELDLAALWWIYGGDGLGGIDGINSLNGPTLANSPPVASNTTVQVNEDTLLNGMLPAASDFDNDAIAYSKASNPAHGSASVSANGSFTYTPAANYHGTDSFTYAVTDSLGASNIYTVNLIIAPLNDAPTLTPPTAASYTDTAADNTFANATGTLLGSDVDAGTTLTYGLTGGTVAAGVASKVGIYGSLSVNTATGAYTYTPNDAAIEAVKSNVSEAFTVTVSDGSASASASFMVNVTGANDPTVFAGASTGAVTEDGTQTAAGTLSATDRDTGDAAIVAQTNSAGVYGTFSIAANGAWSYALNNGAANVQALNAGQSVVDTFAIATAGGATQTVTLTINGANDVNVINGSTNDDTLYGTIGNDTINGLAGNDVLVGLAGNDTLVGEAGSDTMVGGLGDDIFYVDEVGDSAQEIANGGTDALVVAIATPGSSYTLADHIENSIIVSAVATNLTGNAEANLLMGNAANNVLSGLGGNDVLFGGGGTDTLIGGLGDEIYVVDDISDQVIEAPGAGADTVLAAILTDGITFTLSASVENAIASGSAALNLTGNAEANFLIGNTASNILIGADGNDALLGDAGNDVIYGGRGLDTLLGGADQDSFLFDSAGSGNVGTIYDFVAVDDVIVLENGGSFSALTTPGTLSAGSFVAGPGAVALQLDDLIVYDTATGNLYYDPDGSGAAAALHFATVIGAPALTQADFLVI